MLLETERLLLQPYEWDNLQQLQAILSDSVTMQFWPAPFTLEQSQRWMRESLESYESGFGRLGVFHKGDGTLIGDAGLRITDIDGKREHDLGYIIHEKHWRQGYGREAASAVLSYGLDKLRLTRICANMPVDHHGSKRVAIELGMVMEKEFLNPKNRNIPTYLYVYDALFNERNGD